jgi:DNA polymerase III delta subunit
MIVTLSGTNDFLIESELKKLISEFRSKNDSADIEQIDASESDLQAIIEAVTNLSFLEPNRFIVLRRGSSNKPFMEAIEKILSNTPPTNELIIIEPNIDKRLSYYKTLKKNTDFRNYDLLEFGQIANWIVQITKDRGGIIDMTDSRYLIEVAGNNQLRLDSEINKLLNYNKSISRESIDLLVEPIPQTTIFQLLDAAFSGNRKELLRIYDDQKKQKVEPQQVIAMLAWQLHILALIKAAGNMSPGDIAKNSKVSPFVINKSLAISKRMTRSDLQKLTNNLLELDVKLKTQTIDADDALLQLLLTIEK